MKNRTLSRLFFLPVLAFLSSCQEPSVAEEQVDTGNAGDVREIIEEKNAQVSALFASGQIDSVASIFADSLVMFVPHQNPLVGKEQFREYWGQMAEFGQLEFDVSTQEVKQSGDLAVERGTFELHFTPNENSPIPTFHDEGSYVVVWEKINGDWKPVWDAPVSELPLQPPPPAAGAK